MPLLPRKVGGSLEYRTSQLLGVRPASSAIRGRLDRDRQPRWQELFDADDRDFFQGEAGELLIELGYESSGDWVAGSAL